MSWFGRASLGKLRSKRRTRWVISFFLYNQIWSLILLVVSVGYGVFTAVRAICMLVRGTI